MSKIELIFKNLFLLLMSKSPLNETKTVVAPEYSKYVPTTPQYSRYDERLKEETEKEIKLWKMNLYNKLKPNIEKKIMKNIDKAYNNINKRMKERKFTSKIYTFDLPDDYMRSYAGYKDKVKKIIIDDIIKSLNNSKKYNVHIDTNIEPVGGICICMYYECEVRFTWK